MTRFLSLALFLLTTVALTAQQDITLEDIITPNKMKITNIDYYCFNFGYTSSHVKRNPRGFKRTSLRESRFVGLYVEPLSVKEFLDYSESLVLSKNVLAIIKKITEVITLTSVVGPLGTGQEAYMKVNPVYTELILTLPIDFKPVRVSTPQLLAIFQEYRDWLQKLENGQIPGLLPTSKLDDWVCVPKAYVKEEYWDM